MATTITIVCPHCKYRMRASSEHIGHKGRCPNPDCRQLVDIKGPAGEESLAAVYPTSATKTSQGHDARLSSTNVPVWLGGIIGAAFTAALYLAIFLPLRHKWFVANLFASRGIMQYCITLVICWGLSLLVMKYMAVKRQLSYAELELESSRWKSACRSLRPTSINSSRTFPG